MRTNTTRSGACGRPPVRYWLADPLPKEAAKQLERLSHAPDVRHLAVMPDAHAGVGTCNGVVLATSNIVYPQAVGSDIGCGMTASRFTGAVPPHAAWPEVLPALQRQVRILTRPPGSCAMPDPRRLSHASLEKAAERDGAREAGTLGRGNHFVEIQVDDAGSVWALVHSGSRAMGQAITGFHLRGAPDRGLMGLDAAGAGAAYLADAAWACEFAAMSRCRLLDGAAEALAAFGLYPDPASMIDTCHNLVRAEVHSGATLLVHRKGAATATAGEAGVIPGSAGTFTVHVEGRGCADALASSSHGAGRVRSRSQAVREVSASRFQQEMGAVTYDRRQSRRLVDEAPSVYRDLRKVMAAQRDLVKITRTLRPVVSVKGV